MNAQVQQMMALAAQGGQPQQQQGVAVGACGPMANPAQAGYPAQMAAAQGLAMLGEGGIPPMGGAGCRPLPPISNQLQDCAVYTECYTPFGIQFGVDSQGNIYNFANVGGSVDPSLVIGQQAVFFTRVGIYMPYLFKSFVDPGIVEVDSLTGGDADTNFLLGPTDAATWNSDECGCPVDWPCFSITNPVRIQARAINAAGVDQIQGFSGTCWGLRASTYNSCGPLQMCGPGGY